MTIAQRVTRRQEKATDLRLRVLVVMLVLPLSGWSWPWTSQWDHTNELLEEAIHEFDTQSIQWQDALRKLEKDLAADSQSTVRNEVTTLLQTGIASASGEFRCDADFIADRMKVGLMRILAVRKKDPLPREEYFCQLIPDQINLMLDSSRRTGFKITGYNLREEDVHVSVVDSKGHRRDIQKSDHVLSILANQIVVNISDTNGLQFFQGDQQLLFHLTEGQEHGVNIVAASRVFSIQEPGIEVEAEGGADGTVFTDTCPDGSIGVGLQGRAGGGVNGIELLCSHLNPDGTLAGASSTAYLGYPGGGGPYNVTCTDSVLAGLSGMYAPGEGEKLVLSQLVGRCASVVKLRPTDPPPKPIGAGGYFNHGVPFTRTCSPDSAITAITVKVAPYIQHIGFVCKRITSSPASSLPPPASCTTARTK